MANIESQVSEALMIDREFRSRIESSNGTPWRAVTETIKQFLPEYLDDRDGVAYRLVPKVLTTIYGPQREGWESYKNPNRNNTTYVRKKE
jgi:hypothetical protein